MSTPALDVRNLSYRIDGKDILRDVSFTVPEGAYVSVVGPNGAGKTTLLRCLNRILREPDGEIFVHGRHVQTFSQAELAIELGYVPQGGGGDVPFSVYEFVMMGRYPHLSAFTSPTEDDDEAVLSALELAGARDLVERTCATLSGGERQKVFIAAALAQDARILLLDEPTTFLDPHHQYDILSLLHRLHRESGYTIFAVTHDINAAVMSSDNVLALRDGRVAYCGPSGDFLDQDVLAEIFGLAFHFVAHPVTGQRMIVPEAVG